MEHLTLFSSIVTCISFRTVLSTILPSFLKFAGLFQRPLGE